MATFSRAIYRIAQFLRWNEKEQLILQPKFQRRPSWEPAARSYLIDTIVRELPIPKVYLRKVVSPKTGLMAYEVVDGQQRLRAILDFYAGALTLNPRYSPKFGSANFSTLPEAVQRSFLDYEISTEVMEKASDPEVWAMFERLNTYTLTLNTQERLNARWFGYFKQTAYKLAAEEFALQVWQSLKIFSDRQIARMREVELTSDILVALVDGISDITDIGKAYAKYDKDFPKREKISDRFKDSLSWIVNNVEDTIRDTRFRRKAWFYSLSLAVADALWGIPKGKGPKTLREKSEIIERMLELDHALKMADPAELPKGLTKLQHSLSRQTSHIPPRRVRHAFFFSMLTSANTQWKNIKRR
jgi:hypothetical protein